MAKAIEQNTHPYYDAEVRKQIRQHLERATARRKGAAINYTELWDQLEIIARTFNFSVRELVDTPSYSFADVVAWFDDNHRLASSLAQKLRNPPDLRLISAQNLWFGHELSEVKELDILSAKLEEGANTLREVFAGQQTHVYGPRDCVSELKVVLFRMGQELLGLAGPGRSDGPLVEFVCLALQPALGDATPNHDALRIFAQRHHPSS